MNRGSLPYRSAARRSRTARWLPWLALSLALLLLGACAPGTDVESNVQPTVISVCGPPTCADSLVIQGRNFGDGAGGANTYVVAGADVAGRGGVRVPITSWAPNRIVTELPTDAGYGYLFVIVSGVRSSGLPVSLP